MTIQWKREATSMIQYIEWDMLGLQGSFPWLKDKFRFEDREEMERIENGDPSI